MRYTIKIEPEAVRDIQEAIDWYNRQRPSLGQVFYKKIDAEFEILKTYPHFQMRYDAVRCLPVRKFPFMIHYTLDEENKTVIVRAVFSTHRNPAIWKQRP